MLNIQIETDPLLQGLDNGESVKILTHILHSEKIVSGDISIIFGNKKLLRDLKKEFFQIDKVTDVIAFRLNDYKEKVIEGEIYICLPVAEENSKIFGESFETELARLIIHGGLHLVGYDDSTKSEQKEMRKLEEKYFKELEC